MKLLLNCAMGSTSVETTKLYDAGVSSTDWSWGGLLADFDNDGWKDLFVTNGIRRDVNNKDFYAEHREFFKKMESDPDYKGKEEEVELLNYLEQIPSEQVIFIHLVPTSSFEGVPNIFPLISIDKPEQFDSRE